MPILLKLRLRILGRVWSVVCLMVLCHVHGSTTDGTLEQGFGHPAASFLPETWFHLIGGNISKEGLTADLEAVSAGGFSGIHLFHGSSRSGAWPGVIPQVGCLTAEWEGMIRHAADECQRLDLSFAMQNCPGWNMSGGPWIEPSRAMRHLVWKGTVIQGGDSPAVPIAIPDEASEPWRDYRDVAVLAFPCPAGADDGSLIPISGSGYPSNIPWEEIVGESGGAPTQATTMKPGASWVDIRFGRPVTVRSLVLPSVSVMSRQRFFDPGIRISIETVEGNNRHLVVARQIPRSNWQDDRPLTLALPEATADGFRVTFENRHSMVLPEMKFLSAAHVDNMEAEAGYVLRSLNPEANPSQSAGSWIDPDQIIDLSGIVGKDWKLHHALPHGTWMILRFGHVNTGAKNHPAPPEATGYECDKFSKEAADLHFDAYIGRLSAPHGPVASLSGLLIDSWECRTQTWTPGMERHFGKLRGYGLRSWLPVLAGRVVGNPELSRRFLRDWRATLNDLLVENYYGQLARRARQRGMRLMVEAGPGDVAIGDILQYYGKADVPMCEFWWPNDPHWGGLDTKPVLPAASAAVLYGKPVVAAEAFTSIRVTWDEHPFMLKHLADRHFAMGVNHMVFHTYTHNPRMDVRPGTSFGGNIGTPFLRGQTWWDKMPLFTSYLARCGFLLQQGQPVADVLWYLGDGIDHKPPQNHGLLSGYRYHYLNQDALLDKISVEKGRIRVPGGASWRMIYLPNQTRITAASLARLRDLVRSGAIVCGLPSLDNPSLEGGAAADHRFRSLVIELWGDSPGESGERFVGSGKLIWGIEPDRVLAALDVQPDVIGANSALWHHRRVGEQDIYFIAADRAESFRASLSFRTKGVPRLWNPLDGSIRTVPVWRHDGERTIVPLDLPAAGAVFVVIGPGQEQSKRHALYHDGTKILDAWSDLETTDDRPFRTHGLARDEEVQPAISIPDQVCDWDGEGRRLLVWKPGSYYLTRDAESILKFNTQLPASQGLDTGWELSLPSGNGNGDPIVLPTLKPWSEIDDPSVHSFSGTAVYSNTFNIDSKNPDLRYQIDLGQVSVIAEVHVNGQLAATLWCPPFRADVTRLVRTGANTLQIQVTGNWHNRLRYEAALPEAERTTWTINPPKKESPRRSSGLAGPVRIITGCWIELPE